MTTNQWVNYFSDSDINLSFSRLRHAISHDWAHFRHYELNKPVVGAPANFSRLFHQILLEPAINLEILYEPEFNLRTLAGKQDFAFWGSQIPNRAIVCAKYHSAAWMIEKLDRSDLTIIQEDDVERANRMAAAVRSRPFWQALNGKAEFEKAGEFDHNGVTVRFKADIISKELTLLADIKAMPDVSPEAVSRKALEYMIDMQAALYLRGASLIDNVVYKNFVIVAVENNEPYCVQEYTLHPHIIESAWDILSVKLDEYKTCKINDFWPERSKKPIELPWPNWMLNKREGLINVEQ